MKDDVFSAANAPLILLHDPVIVLGRRLLPLSLWHICMLKEQDSPYITGGEVKIQDLAIAVLICSMNRETFSHFMSDEKSMQKAADDMVDSWLLKKEGDQRECFATFLAYINASFNAPEFWEEEKSNQIKDRLRCPIEWHLIIMLLKERICNTEEDAWNYSYQRAVCWRAVISEANGSRNYIDPLDRMQIQELNHD